jgi:hypothetical protein
VTPVAIGSPHITGNRRDACNLSPGDVPGDRDHTADLKAGGEALRDRDHASDLEPGDQAALDVRDAAERQPARSAGHADQQIDRQEVAHRSDVREVGRQPGDQAKAEPAMFARATRSLSVAASLPVAGITSGIEIAVTEAWCPVRRPSFNAIDTSCTPAEAPVTIGDLMRSATIPRSWRGALSARAISCTAQRS